VWVWLGFLSKGQPSESQQAALEARGIVGLNDLPPFLHCADAEKQILMTLESS
jgi:hypothetical protein